MPQSLSYSMFIFLLGSSSCVRVVCRDVSSLLSFFDPFKVPLLLCSLSSISFSSPHTDHTSAHTRPHLLPDVFFFSSWDLCVSSSKREKMFLNSRFSDMRRTWWNLSFHCMCNMHFFIFFIFFFFSFLML